jgi:SH3-like domain-containing protein
MNGNRSRMFLMLLFWALGGLAGCAQAPHQPAPTPTADLSDRLQSAAATQTRTMPTRTAVSATAAPTSTAAPTRAGVTSPATARPGSTVAAAPVLQLRVAVSSANVRRGPGIIYDAARILLENQTVTVVARTSSGFWFLVRLDDGTEGWLAASVTEPVTDAAALAAALTAVPLAATLPPTPTATPTATTTATHTPPPPPPPTPGAANTAVPTPLPSPTNNPYP